MPRDTAAQREAIVRAAQEVGMDPATALAIAERESNFDPTARSSKTIRGMYQMRGDHRARHGVGDSDDPGQQTKGWAAFFKDVKREMGSALGRDPTDAEGYLGHHFGGVRAGRMMKMDPSTPVDSVFTPREMAENPHFAKAGTVGALNSSIVKDIEKRQAKFGGQAPGLGLIDFASQGAPVDNGIAMESHGSDFSGGAALAQGTETTVPPTLSPSAPAASSAPDFSTFGVPA